MILGKRAYSLTRLKAKSDTPGKRRGEAEDLRPGPMAYVLMSWTNTSEAGK